MIVLELEGLFGLRGNSMSVIHKLQNFPFITLPVGLLLLRTVTAILFAAHAFVRIAKGSIAQFGTFMESVGFPFGVAWVWVITIIEIVAALLLIANRLVRPAAASLLVIAFTGIMLIHRNFGWFVGEHGTGGAEYSVALIFMLLVIASADRETQRHQSGEIAE
jgi:putative oxidoreductase